MTSDELHRGVAELEPLPEGQMPLRTFVGITQSVDALLAALRALPQGRIIGSDGRPYRYFWQPGINHLRQHREHIATALAKEGAIT